MGEKKHGLRKKNQLKRQQRGKRVKEERSLRLRKKLQPRVKVKVKARVRARVRTVQKKKHLLPSPKKLPKIPKTFWVRYIAASSGQEWLMQGKGLRRAEAPVTFGAIDAR